VPFLSLAWRYNLAITNSQVQCQISCLHIKKICKPLENNICKQFQLRQVIVTRLVIDFGELVKVALKGRMGKEVGMLGKS
jgi:hypothetical protein